MTTRIAVSFLYVIMAASAISCGILLVAGGTVLPNVRRRVLAATVERINQVNGGPVTQRQVVGAQVRAFVSTVLNPARAVDLRRTVNEWACGIQESYSGIREAPPLEAYRCALLTMLVPATHDRHDQLHHQLEAHLHTFVAAGQDRLVGHISKAANLVELRRAYRSYWFLQAHALWATARDNLILRQLVYPISLRLVEYAGRGATAGVFAALFVGHTRVSAFAAWLDLASGLSMVGAAAGAFAFLVTAVRAVLTVAQGRSPTPLAQLAARHPVISAAVLVVCLTLAAWTPEFGTYLSTLLSS